MTVSELRNTLVDAGPDDVIVYSDDRHTAFVGSIKLLPGFVELQWEGLNDKDNN